MRAGAGRGNIPAVKVLNGVVTGTRIAMKIDGDVFEWKSCIMRYDFPGKINLAFRSIGSYMQSEPFRDERICISFHFMNVARAIMLWCSLYSCLADDTIATNTKTCIWNQNMTGMREQTIDMIWNVIRIPRIYMSLHMESRFIYVGWGWRNLRGNRAFSWKAGGINLPEISAEIGFQCEISLRVHLHDYTDETLYVALRGERWYEAIDFTASSWWQDVQSSHESRNFWGSTTLGKAQPTLRWICVLRNLLINFFHLCNQFEKICSSFNRISDWVSSVKMWS